VVHFLSSDYFDVARETLDSHPGFTEATRGVTLGVQFAVTDGPDGDVSYGLVVRSGAVDIALGQIEHPNVSITNDYATAIGISRGELNTQMAFINGRLRIEGDIAALMRNQTLIQQFSSAMSEVEVTY